MSWSRILCTTWPKHRLGRAEKAYDFGLKTVSSQHWRSSFRHLSLRVSAPSLKDDSFQPIRHQFSSVTTVAQDGVTEEEDGVVEEVTKGQSQPSTPIPASPSSTRRKPAASDVPDIRVDSPRQQHLADEIHATTLNPFQCPECPKSFAVQYCLERHQRFSHPKPPVHCPLCDQSFWNEATLKTHMEKRHNPANLWECAECGRRYPAKGSLLKHEKLHFPRAFPCPHCEESFTIQGNLDRHVRTCHPSKTRFHCKLCNWSTSRTDTYQYHLQQSKTHRLNVALAEAGKQDTSKP